VFHGGVRQPCSVSLSHREGQALAVVGPPEAQLGCDLEIVEPRSRAFVEDYFTVGERHRLSLAPPEDRDRLANLVWSAKESAVKALRTGLRVDTRTADVHLLLRDEEKGWRPLRVRRAGAPPLEGWWRQDGLRLATVVSAPAPNRPVRLVSPSRPWPVQRERARSA
jgi:4'-phosphopantetheinyl transferase